MKKTTSDTSQTPSRANKPKNGTTFGRALVSAAAETLAHIRGEAKLGSYELPRPIDIKAIRRKVGMSQARFASAFALNPRTLQQWEQGKAQPDGAVRAYLTVIERNPGAVVEALTVPAPRA